MDAVIVYWSRFGNGKRVVRHLAKELEDKGVDTHIFRPRRLDPTSMPQADFYVFSSPTEAFRIQRKMRKFMKKLKGVEGRKYGIINTHGMKRNWLKSMEKILSGKKGMVKIAGIDFKIGDSAETGNDLPDGWQKKVEKFAVKLVNS